MHTATGAAVVVGVDGSDAALRAVRVGVTEAHLRQRPLRVVHAIGWPGRDVAAEPSPAGPLDGGFRHEAERIVAKAIAEARAEAPDLNVTSGIAEGEPAEALLGEAPGADLLVLGERGLGGLGSLLVGSVAVRVAEHADCPVLVVRGDGRRTGPVVVGVDGSELSDLAIGFAVSQAALHDTELVAVHVYDHPVSTDAGDTRPLAHDIDELRSDEGRLLAESIAGWGDRYPDVPIIARLVRGRPGPMLIEQSARARLIVVGAHGRRELTGLMSGSVSRTLLQHSHCPVSVVRPLSARDPERAISMPARDTTDRAGR